MNALRTLVGTVDPVRLVRLYIWVLGAGLLLDGLLLLIVNALGLPAPVNATDVEHNVLHVVWGIALLVVSFLARDGREVRVAWAAVIFGAFYVALGIAGLTFDNPFGLQLGPGENAFHLIVGPLALVLGGWALKTISERPVPSHTPARPAEFRSAPAARRRAHRRPGKGHARQHRR